MALVETGIAPASGWFRPDLIKHQLRDYYDISTKLIWQRQIIFFSATFLTAFYYDPVHAFVCYAAVLLTEMVDLVLARRIAQWKDADPDTAQCFMIWVITNTVLSALAICIFVGGTALQGSGGGHFTPLFILFAASLFAAMNNHQFVPALLVRLGLYGLTFVFIAVLDIWRYSPPMNSEIWMHFFTVAFVMFFIIDCSIVFLKLYRRNVRQLEKLSREHMRAVAAVKVKSEFVSTVSHELRTPLTSIKGSLDLMSSGALGEVPEQMQSMVDMAVKNSHRLSLLIDDILDLQKIEAGELRLRLEPLNLRDLLADSVEANRGYADKLGIGLFAELPAGPGVHINGDEARLMQVMANITSNALKFSDPGGRVTVSYSVHGRRVRIAVKDRGVGIPDAARATIFERFRQLDSSDQRQVGGTGLGLNITKSIVERHNGYIDFISAEGEGTTFFVDLDLLDMPDGPDAPSPH